MGDDKADHDFLGLAVDDAVHRAVIAGGLGFLLGCFFSLIAVVQYLRFGEAVVEGFAGGLSGLILFYLLGCGVAGGLSGLLWPLCRSKYHALVVGGLAGFPAGLALHLMASAGMPSDTDDWVLVVTMGFIIGGPIMGGIWESDDEASPSASTE